MPLKLKKNFIDSLCLYFLDFLVEGFTKFGSDPGNNSRGKGKPSFWCLVWSLTTPMKSFPKKWHPLPQPQLSLWWPLPSFCFSPYKSPSLASCPILELCPQLTFALVPDSSMTSPAEAPPWSLKKKNDNPENSLYKAQNICFAIVI